MHHQNTHHKIIRKNNNKKIKYQKLIDKSCIIFSILMPATTIPQIYKIFSTQNVEGISLSMWILYSIGVIPFLLYGILHKEKPLIILNILWLIAQITIITGIILYM